MTICSRLPLSCSTPTRPRCLMLPAGAEVVLRSHRSLYKGAGVQARFDEDESNSAIELTLQAELEVDPVAGPGGERRRRMQNVFPGGHFHSPLKSIDLIYKVVQY